MAAHDISCGLVNPGRDIFISKKFFATRMTHCLNANKKYFSHIVCIIYSTSRVFVGFHSRVPMSLYDYHSVSLDNPLRENYSFLPRSSPCYPGKVCCLHKCRKNVNGHWQFRFFIKLSRPMDGRNDVVRKLFGIYSAECLNGAAHQLNCGGCVLWHSILVYEG